MTDALVDLPSMVIADLLGITPRQPNAWQCDGPRRRDR
ncbi:hypothetical protein SMA5143A_7054 [Streptomyces sp. MA5143a]|nr:hypothetical protein SMA5143A_7054 [Streptomyces sp. MA5143a]